MDRCPTCATAWKGGDACHRCRTDFRQILAVEEASARRRRDAERALVHGRTGEAAGSAHRACRLHGCEKSFITLARAALADGDHRLALAVWRKIRSLQAPGDNPSSSRFPQHPSSHCGGQGS